MKRILAMTIVTCFAANAGAAQTEGERLGAALFASIDSDSSGSVTMEEYQSYAADVFYSMDNNQDEVLNWDEFSNWDFGMANFAEATGRLQAYETARRIVFSTWDRSQNGEITGTEQRRGIATDFFTADDDRDGSLSEVEFDRYSITTLTMRAAVNPSE